jgi:hypothetical protein
MGLGFRRWRFSVDFTRGTSTSVFRRKEEMPHWLEIRYLSLGTNFVCS